MRNIQVKIRRSDNDSIRNKSNNEFDRKDIDVGHPNDSHNILARTQIAKKPTSENLREIQGDKLINKLANDNDDCNDNNKTPNISSNKRKRIDVPILLDVFVIGSNAQCQLERFFKLTNIHPHNQNNLKLILSTTAGQCQTKKANSNCENITTSSQIDPIDRPTEEQRSKLNNKNLQTFIQPQEQLDKHSGQKMLDNQAGKILKSSEQEPIAKSDSIIDSKIEISPKLDINDDKNNIKDQIRLDNGRIKTITPKNSRDSITQVQSHEIPSEAPSDLCRIARRLIDSLDGQFSQLTEQSNLLQLLAIYETILSATNRKNSLKKPLLKPNYNNNNNDNSSILMNELLVNVNQILRKNGNFPLKDETIVQELLSIICGHELDSVCGAYDQLANLVVEYEPLEMSSKSDITTNDNKNINNINKDNNNNNIIDIQRNNEQQNIMANEEVNLAPIRGETKGKNVRTVHIDKSSNKALGATIKNDGTKVVIGRVVYGGLAQKSGLLAEGDEILEVNGISMHGKNINQVVELIQVMDGTLSLTMKIKNVDNLDSNAELVSENNNNDFKNIDASQDNRVKENKKKKKLNSSIGNQDELYYNEDDAIRPKLFVRAFFDFDGQQDEFIPCKELALSFQKGEILSIIDRSDATWWQANRHLEDQLNDSDSSSFQLAGLIPSLQNVSSRNKHDRRRNLKLMQIQMQQAKQNCNKENSMLSGNNANGNNSNVFTQANVHYYHDDDYDILETKKNLVSRLFNCPTSVVPPKRRPQPTSATINQVETQKLQQLGQIEQTGQSLHNILISNSLIDQIPYYEQVELFYPRQVKGKLKRPIIFVGPKMIGQRDLINKLISLHPQRFASPISHTTRQRLPQERDGIDFHFVTRESFELLMEQGKFIECGQFQGQYYGTSFDSISRLVNSGKTCLHLISIPSIFNFHHGKAGCELKPFLVFVKPKCCNDIVELRQLIAMHASNFAATSTTTTNRKQQQQQIDNLELDSSARAIMEEIELVEAHLLAYFDLVIDITPDIDRIQAELILELNKIQDEPQWIPKFWTTSKC